MRCLKVCLWVAGLGCLLGVFGIFLPMRVVGLFIALFEVEMPVDSAVMVYFWRLGSAMSAVIGLFYIILALRPMEYGVLDPFSGLGAIFAGLVCGVVGLLAGLPWAWFMSDCLSCVLLGVLILVFWRRVRIS